MKIIIAVSIIIFSTQVFNIFGQDIVKIDSNKVPFYISSNETDFIMNDPMFWFDGKDFTHINDKDYGFHKSIEKINYLSKYINPNDFINYQFVIGNIIENFGKINPTKISLGVKFKFKQNTLISSFINSTRTRIKSIGYDEITMGKYVVISDPLTYMDYTFGNLDDILVFEGQNIKYNDLIGTAKNNILYFTIKRHSFYINPICLLKNSLCDKYLTYSYFPKNMNVYNHTNDFMTFKIYQEQEYTEKMNYFIDELKSMDISFPLTNYGSENIVNFTEELIDSHHINVGIDYQSPKGELVLAPVSGTIIQRMYDAMRLGNYVIIRSNKGYLFILGHLDQVFVNEKDKIQIGDRIGSSGSTGFAFEPSLYIGIVFEDYYFNPDLIFHED